MNRIFRKLSEDREPAAIAKAAMQASLLVASIATALLLGKKEGITEALKSTKEKLPDSAWLYIGCLLFGAILFKWIWGAFQHCWFWLARRKFAPVAFILNLGIVWSLYPPNGALDPLIVVAFILLLGTCCWMLWPSRSNVNVVSDKLYRDYFAERIAELFADPKTMNRRVAVLGTWGSGKTTVLNLLREKLATQNRTLPNRIGEPMEGSKARGSLGYIG